MIVSEWGDRVSIFKIGGQGKIRTFRSHGDRTHEMKYPTGLATDDADNIYVSSCHKLQKFTSRGELIKCTGKKGKKVGEFESPRGLTLYNNEVYVCDSDNHRIQIFDLDSDPLAHMAKEEVKSMNHLMSNLTLLRTCMWPSGVMGEYK